MRGSPRSAAGLTPWLLVAALLGSCAPVEGPAARPPDREPVRVDESLGVVRVPAGGPVLVRMVLDTTGDAEGLAEVLEAAFRTAVEDFGSVQQGFRVDLGTTLVTDCTRSGGERAAGALADDAVVGVLGPQCVETLLGLQQGLAAGGTVVVTPRVQESSLTVTADGTAAPDRTDATWRTAPSSLHEALAAATHAALGLEHTRAAVLHDGTDEAVELASAFQGRFEALGGTVVVRREVDAALRSEDPEQVEGALAPLLDAVAAGEVDTAFLALPAELLLPLADGWSAQGRLRGVTRITTSRAASADLLADEASLGHLIVGPLLDFPDAVSAVTGMSASQTLERVGATSGSRDPSGWWAYAYDAATLLLKAIEDASLVDVDGSFVLSRAELREGLRRTTFVGLTGTIGCTPLGDCAAPLLAVREHEDLALTALSDLTVVSTVER